MKIKSNLKKNYSCCKNEAMGTNINKKYILKTNKNTSYTYEEHFILIFIMILSISTILLLLKLPCSIELCSIGLFCAFIYILTNIIYFTLDRIEMKKRDYKNEIIIDKDGISDSSYKGMTITIEWKKVKALVLRKHTIIILTDTPCYFYFDISKYKDIIKLCQKYKKNIKIIDY